MSDFFTAYKARLIRNEKELIKLIKDVQEKDPSIEVYVTNQFERHISSVTFIKDEMINGIGFHEVPYGWSGCGYKDIGGIRSPGGHNHCMPFTVDDVINNFEPIAGIRKSQVEIFKNKEQYLKWCSYLKKYQPSNYKTDIHYRPSQKTANVKCLNGSAHLKETFDINQVTCPKCLDKKDEDQNKWWDEFFQKKSK